MSAIRLTVYGRPQPQGSSKGFVVKGRAVVTSDNKNLRPYRGEGTREAMHTLATLSLAAPAAARHVPVAMEFDFYFARPASIPKRRRHMVVKPDLDKLVRATTDALTGVLYYDDAQICEYLVRKHYGTPERVVIGMQPVQAEIDSRSSSVPMFSILT